MRTITNFLQQLTTRMARAAFADKGLYWELAQMQARSGNRCWR